MPWKGTHSFTAHSALVEIQIKNKKAQDGLKSCNWYEERNCLLRTDWWLWFLGKY